MMKAQAQPLSASYTVRMKIDDMEYAVTIQPERRYRMAVLQALQVERHPTDPSCALLTDNSLLASLLEILIHQGVA